MAVTATTGHRRMPKHTGMAPNMARIGSMVTVRHLLWCTITAVRVRSTAG